MADERLSARAVGRRRDSSPAELAGELTRLREIFAGSAVPEGTDYITTVTPGRAMAYGTTTPIVGSQFVRTASGLLLPERLARGPAPIDQMQLYITADELLGVDVSMSVVLDNIRRCTLEDVLVFCAGWLNARRRMGADPRAVDRAFADGYFQDPAHARAATLLRDPMRVLVAPQGLFALMKIACLRSGDVLLPWVEPGNLPLALIGIVNHLGALDEPSPDGAVITGDAGPLGREIISNQLFHAHRSEAGAIRRFVRRWIELPAEHANDPRIVNLEQEFERATGVPLDDLVLVLLALWGATSNDTPRFATDYFDQLGWAPDRLERTLALFTCTVPQLRAEVRGEAAEFDIPWAIATFERFPVVRLSDDSLLVLDPQLLGRRVLGLLPLFDLTDALERRGGRKLKSRVEGCYGHVSELYALEILSGLVPSAGASRFYGEQELRAAYGTGRKVADAALDYGDSWVVVEVTTSRPRRGTVSGQSDAAVSADLDKLVAKAAQLDSTISAVRADAAALTGSAGHPTPRFRPVLVVADGFPVNPISLTLLRERLAAAELLQHHDTAPVEVLDLEELEIVEHLASAGGPSLAELLSGHERSGVMANAALRDYLLLALRLQPRKGTHEAGAMARLMAWLRQRAPGLAA